MMKENEEWARIWDELEREFRERWERRKQTEPPPPDREGEGEWVDEETGATLEEIKEYWEERDDYDEDEEPYIGDWPPPEWRNPDLLAYLAEHEGEE